MKQIFSKSSIFLIASFAIALVGVFLSTIFIIYYWGSPWHTDVGYNPVQPIAFSHKLHAGELSIDCQYCHNFADRSTYAGVPPTSRCMNCHNTIRTESSKLKLLRDNFTSGLPIKWVRVHKIPDYTYFTHEAHLKAGVSCKTCHGFVTAMEQVAQTKPHSMGFCLDCHRNPEAYLVPPDKVTKFNYINDKSWVNIRKTNVKMLHPPVTNCSGCHQ